MTDYKQLAIDINDKIREYHQDGGEAYSTLKEISTLLPEEFKDCRKVTLVLEGERPLSWNMLYSGQGAKRKDGQGRRKGGHWGLRDAEARRVKELVQATLRSEYAEVPLLNTPVRITMIVYFKGAMQDCSNLCLKLYEDGLVEAGLLPDDSPECVEEVRLISRKSNVNPRVEIEIEERN